MKSLEDLLISYKQVYAPKTTTQYQETETQKSPFQKALQNIEYIRSKRRSQEQSTETDSEEQEFEGFTGWDYSGLSQQSDSKTQTQSTSSTSSQTSNNSNTPSTTTNHRAESTTTRQPQSSNDSAVKTAINYFVAKGLTPEQASGFVGNFLSESGLKTDAVNQDEKKKGYSGYGRGIAQWSNERVQEFERVIGKRIEDSSLSEQLDFVWYELEKRPELMRQLKLAKTSDESADLVHRGYENGSSNALATPEQLTRIYSRAWDRLGYRKYNYQDDLRIRQDRARKTLNEYYS